LKTTADELQQPKVHPLSEPEPPIVMGQKGSTTDEKKARGDVGEQESRR